MDRGLKLLGSQSSFGFSICWTESGGSSAAELTRGTATVWVAGTPAWGPEGLDWTWVELLEHLGRFWADLVLEETDPLGLQLPIEKLRAAAESRWAEASGAREEDEEHALFDYLEAHDLAAGLMGVFPPSLFVTRQGDTFRIAAHGAIAIVPRREAEATLTGIGEVIADRLRGVEDERAARAVAGWEARTRASTERLLSLSTGLTEAQLESLEPDLAALLAVNDFESVRDSSELRAVARMSAAALPVEDVANILAWVNAQPQVWTGAFARYTEAATAALEERALEPAYEQGAAVARMLRNALGFAASQRVDPQEILRSWKIEIADLRLSSRHLDAVCTWGPKHGPAIAVNRAGPHGRFVGRRATLAHEIGHLLMDRGSALPLGEVLGGSVPQQIEQRARAFAAELLLPQEAAVPALKASNDPDLAVRELADRFGCSREIVAWQVRNGWGGPLPHALYSRLRSLVQIPSRF